jgi:hypothetical protein
VVEFRESSDEIFQALPRIFEAYPQAIAEDIADTVLADLRRRVAGRPREELFELWKEADFREEIGQLPKAIALSEEAMAKAGDLHIWPYEVRPELAKLVRRRLSAADPEQHRRADQEIEQLAEGRADADFAELLLMRVSARLSDANIPDTDPAELNSNQRAVAVKAMADVERAAGCDLGPIGQGAVMLARAAMCRVLSRDGEGMRASTEAISFFRGRLPATSLPPAQWSDRVAALQAVYSYRAELLSREHPPRVREMFECADDGRSQLLRHQLAWARVGSDSERLLDRLSYPELRSLLHDEQAAMVQFEVNSQHTSVLIVDPRETEPQYQRIDLKRRDLTGHLPADITSDRARPDLFEALPFFSEKLVPALSGVLDRYPMIYLVPSAELYSVPFAGLTLERGDYVIEHCALAHVPSASILRWCLRRRGQPAGRSFLALGVGSDGSHSFAAQAREVTAQVAKLPGVLARLLPETTRGAEFLDQAEHASIVHLECHGTMPSKLDPLAKSCLKLADELTAQQVAQRENRLPAELVFLNSCLSGAFARTVPNEAGGFWNAFLLAGAASLVATLTKVEPGRASELVVAFYEEWLGRGAGKAAALQAAQRRMLAAGVGPEHWATHILVGDPR